MLLKKRLCVGAFVLACAASPALSAAADGLEPLSTSDVQQYAAAFDAADRGDFIDAQMKAVGIRDKTLLGYLSFRQLMHPSAHVASFDELSEWLAKFRDLPLADRVFSLASKRKPDDAQDPPQPTLSDQDMAGAALPTVDLSRMAREAFYSGDAVRALEYAPAAGERWVAGLAAWRLGRYPEALSWFAEVAMDEEEDAWLRSGAAYWAARTAGQLGDSGKARGFLRLAAQYPTTFYGMIADRQVRLIATDTETGEIVRASYQSPSPVRRVAPPKADAELVKFAARQPRAHRAAALAQLGRLDEARDELRAGLALAKDDAEKQNWTALIAALGAATPERASAAPSRRTALPPSEYPTPELTPKAGFTVDKALVYAIAYQESRFNPQAVSPVGAIGLMQLMPESAARVTGDDKLKRNPKPLFDPAVNLRAGQDYLTYLMERGVGYDILRTVAAYNGGPGAVLRTLDKVGQDADPLLIIECLPAQETRDYVEKVMAAYWTYRRQWGQATPTLDAVATGARRIDVRLDLVQPDPIGALLSAYRVQGGLP